MSILRLVSPLLFAALALAGAIPSRAAEEKDEATRLRILLVIDTEGHSAKENGFALDQASMKRAIKETLREQNLEDRYTLDILHGQDVTPEKLLAYYRNLKVAPTETLFCYYSGHGGSDKERGHFLQMKGGRLFRSELRAAMEARRPRLLVLLSDCCADYGTGLGLPTNRLSLILDDKDAPKDGRRKRAEDGARQNTLKVVRGETFRRLLFGQRGVVDISACEVGKVAFSSRSRGGYFTTTLTGLLGVDGDRFESDPDGSVGWGGFFHVLQTATSQRARNDAYSQTPRAFALPGEKR
ncbi:MAG: caspase family protein [Gemmataceae bacterium]|nr:caspase family protein [Gemmataceae bacterium]